MRLIIVRVIDLLVICGSLLAAFWYSYLSVKDFLSYQVVYDTNIFYPQFLKSPSFALYFIDLYKTALLDPLQRNFTLGRGSTIHQQEKSILRTLQVKHLFTRHDFRKELFSTIEEMSPEGELKNVSIGKRTQLWRTFNLVYIVRPPLLQLVILAKLLANPLAPT